ncbi:MAG: subclass B3 metallo-beta-lactamase [Xanthomonadales bacterium]|nr:subclass B3 metallo-beta-lactamase [Xanthomonadales bacterium]
MKLIALLFGLATPWAADYATDPEMLERFGQPFEPFHIAGNVYYVGAHEVSSFLIDTGAGLIVIDGGFFETGPMIEANMKQLGFDVADIRILLNSHAHFDHAAGLAYLQERSGAEVIAMRGDARTLATGDGQFAEFPAVQVNRVIDDGATVSLGETTLTAIATPGHTPGCTTWTATITTEEGPRRAVFLCSLSALSVYNLIDDQDYPDIAADYRFTFAKLEDLEVDIFLAAHGSFFNLEEKAQRRREGAGEAVFIDPIGFANFVADSKARFEALLARQQAERRKNEPN